MLCGSSRGNVIGLITLYAGASTNLMIWIFAGISSAAVVLLFFANPSQTASNVATTVQILSTLGKDIRLFANLILFSRFRLLLPLFIFQGVSQVWSFAIIPTLISPEDGGARMVLFFYLADSIASTIAAPITGKLFSRDRGWVILTAICFAALISALALSSLLVAGVFGDASIASVGRRVDIVVTGGLCGLFHSTITNLINCTLMDLSSLEQSKGDRHDLVTVKWWKSFEPPVAAFLFAVYRFLYSILGFVPMSILAVTTKPEVPYEVENRWWFWGTSIGVAAIFLLFVPFFFWAMKGKVDLSADERRSPAE